MPRRLLVWFQDRAVRKVVRFGIPAAIGKLFMSIAAVATMALLAHRLGPELFGVIAMIRTVVAIVEQYANFNTWQAIVKFGTAAQAEQRIGDVQRVIKLAIVIDIVTAIVSAAVVVALALLIPAAFDWNSHEASLCALYAITLLTRISGACDGIYRICDAYRAQAISGALSAVAITISVAVAILLDAGLAGCVYALIIGEVIANAIYAGTSFWVAGQRDLGGWWRTPLTGARTAFPGILGFLVATSAQLTVKKTNSELDMMFVGAMLGKVSSGLYRVVKQLGTIPGKIFMPFEHVVFTELARAAATHDYSTFMRLLIRFTALVALGSLVVWGIAALAAAPLIEVVAGHEFVAAVDAFRWYLFAMVLVIATAPALRALVALGQPGSLFLLELASMPLIVVGLLVGAKFWGLVGISAAVVLNRAFLLFGSFAVVGRIVRQRRSRTGSSAEAS